MADPVRRALTPRVRLGEPARDLLRSLRDGQEPARAIGVATHDAAALLPALPRTLRRPTALAEPPAGSGLRPVTGDWGYPGVGWTINWMYRGPLAFNVERREEHGRLSWSGMLGRKVLTVASAAAIEAVLRNAEEHWSSEEGWDWLIGPFFSRGLMLLDNPDHHRDRRIMQSAFTRKRLQGYQERMARITAAQLDGWRPGRR